VTPAPDFFVVGAPRAGTTSLYHYLRQHPMIFRSPIKEPAFFAPEVVDFTPASRRAWHADAAALREYLDGPMDTLRDRGIVLDWQDYLKLFRNAGPATARGEVSGNYLPSAGAPAAIRQMIPHARIIMILRDPVERLFSQYSSALAASRAGSDFGDWITGQERAEATRSPRYGPIWTGMYAQHVKRYRAEFPADRIRIYLYDDYRDRPGQVLADLFGFLEVDATFRVDMTERHNVTTFPRWPALDNVLGQLKPLLRAGLPSHLHTRARAWYRRPSRPRPDRADHARLLAVYREDVRELQDLIGRDLSMWLRDPSRERP
jgi:hypothetical protein